MLTRADLRQGETVLITGASGGGGPAAVQLAQARGASVIAVTSASKIRTLRELGTRAKMAALFAKHPLFPKESHDAFGVDPMRADQSAPTDWRKKSAPRSWARFCVLR